MTHVACGIALIAIALGANALWPGDIDPAVPVIFGLILAISKGSHEDAR